MTFIIKAFYKQCLILKFQTISSKLPANSTKIKTLIPLFQWHLGW